MSLGYWLETVCLVNSDKEAVREVTVTRKGGWRWLGFGALWRGSGCWGSTAFRGMGRDKFRDRVALGLLHLAVAILGCA